VDYKKAIGDNTLRLREAFIEQIARTLAKNEGKDPEQLKAEELDPWRKRVEVKRADFDTLAITFQSAADGDVLTTELIRMVDYNFDRIKKNDTEYLLRLNEKKVVEIRDAAVNQTLDIIRKRIDAFGLVEPVVRQSGDTNLEVQLPGVKKSQMDVVRERIGQTAQLIFRIVDHDNAAFFNDKVRPALEQYKAAHADKAPTLEMRKASSTEFYLRAQNKSEMVGFIKNVDVPDDRSVGYEYVEAPKGKVGELGYWRTVWLFAKIELTGEHLTRANAAYDQQNKPYVSLEFDTTGGRIFDEVTGAHVGQDLAIMLDEDVNSAPRIKERIGGGQARIDLGGRKAPQEILEEAKSLVTVLSTGAYKAPVHKVQDYEVGPSLGNEAIQSGKLSLIVGVLAVVVFMIMYYGVAGLYADVALMLNLLILVAVLIGFNSALSLPGMAGIVLTLGMAVDANVLINERIREELRNGKTLKAAVEQGYNRAFWTIFDSNVTTGLAGVILLKFASGPVYGFAVTLVIGIITSMFTSIVVTRMFFDWRLRRKPAEKLSV
jgi:preprotein translocase subunit SecD